MGNIHPKHRSNLKSIQLIAVVTIPLLEEYGFEKVLHNFISDANKLTEASTPTGSVTIKYICKLHCALIGCRLANW